MYEYLKLKLIMLCDSIPNSNFHKIVNVICLRYIFSIDVNGYYERYYRKKGDVKLFVHLGSFSKTEK